MSKPFLDYAEKNGYINTKITRYKKVDKIYTNTTKRTGLPQIKTIILTLRHHIEEVPPEHYSQLLFSLEDRAMIECNNLLWKVSDE